MNPYEKLVRGEETLAVLGLGYVGLPIAVEFSKKVPVIGFDVNREKIELYQKGIDPTREIGDEALAASKARFTTDERELRHAGFHIIAVPTPINTDKTPDLAPVVSASEIVAAT
jgi:UDP-N-acetyl-D-galactosamine dehydrogenase